MARQTIARSRAAVVAASIALGATALLTACASAPIANHASEGDVGAVRQALALGESPEGEDFRGRRALEVAVISRQPTVVEVLLQAGADPHHIGPHGKTPLQHAAERGPQQSLELLLAAGARVDAPSVNGTTALVYALLSEQTPAAPRLLRVQRLLQAGADPNVETPYGTPLDVAVSRDRIDLVAPLLTAGARPDELGRNAMTPLVFAVLGRKTRLAERLLQGGADPNLGSRHGTPLYLAVERDQLELVRALVAAGADPQRPSLGRLTPHELAVRRRRAPIIAALEGRNPGTPNLAATYPPEGSRGVASPPPAPPAPPAPVAASPLRRPPSAIGTLPGLPPDPRFGGYHALVIGNDTYAHFPGLRTAVRDAEAVSQMLSREYGFHVTTLRNATRSEILAALRDYRARLGPADNLLIYYAGHGWLDEDADRGFWLPVDAEPGDETNWLANSAVTGAVRAMEAKHVLVVADSCYAGKLARGIRVRGPTPNELERTANRRARVVMTSGGLEPVIDGGGREGHSIFAAAFLRALGENDGILEGQTLYSQVRRPVMTEADQEPGYADMRKAGHDGGDFLFVRRAGNRPRD